MKSREEVHNKVCDILVELFEVDRADIHPDSQLYDELDIDSIDAVDMLVELKAYTGKKLSPEDFKAVRSVNDVVDAVCELLVDD